MFIKFIVFSVLLHNVISQSLTSDNGNAVVKCVIPPLVLKNGNLTLRGFIFKQSSTTSPVAGDEVKTYVLRATCDPGYERIGSAEVTCPPEDDEVMPECLPICKRQNSEVLTCSAPSDDRVAQCVIPDDGFGSLQLTKGVRWRKNLKCGVANTVSASVAGGRKAGETDVPWHVSVYTKKTQPFMQTCGGTLVSAKLVVSAAHCFWSDLTKKQPAADYAVAVAKLYRPWNDENDVNAQKSDVQEIRIPPRFQGGTTNFQDDIALLITTNAFQFNDFVTPACLDFDYNFDTTQTADGNLARVAGFGLTGQDAGASPVLNMVEMPTVGIEKCISSSDPGFLVSITSDKICAGFKNGTAVCRGDSGGGLAVPFEGEVSFHYFLRGVVSSAPKNDHSCNVYAVATFTHIIKHEHFIKQALEDAANLKTSPITTEPTFNIGIIEPTLKAIVEQPSVDQNRVDQAAEDRNTVDQIISKKSIIDEEKNNMADSGTTPEEYVYKEPIFRSLATGKRIFLREIPKSEQAESNKKINDNIQEIIDNNNATKKVSNANTAEIPTEIISKILSGIDQPKPTIVANKSPISQNLKTENNPVNIPSAEAQKNEKFCKEFLEKNKNQAPNDKHWCNHYDFNYNYHHEYHYDYPNVQYQYQIPNNNQNSPLSPQNQPNVQLSNQNAQNSQLSNQNVQLNQNAQIGHVNGQNVVLNNQVPIQSNAQSNKNVQFAQNTQTRPTNGQNPEVIYQNMFIPQNSHTQSPQLSIQNVEPNNEIPEFIALNGQNPQIIEISQPNAQLGNQNVIFNNQNAQLIPPNGQAPQIFFENVAFSNQNPLSQPNAQTAQLSNQNAQIRPPNSQPPQFFFENVAFNNQNPLSQPNAQNGQLSNQNVQLNNRFAEINPSNGQQPQSNYQNVAFNQQNTQVSHPNDYSAQFSKQNLDVNERNAQIIHPNGENTQAVQQNVDFNHRGAQVSRPNPQNAQLGYQELQLNKQNSQISHSNGQNAQLSHQNVDFLAQNSQTSEQNGQNHHSHHNVHLYHHDTQYNYQNPPVQFDNKNIQVYY